MKPNINAILYIDGACEPKNPGGIATFGWIIYWKGELSKSNYGFICKGNGATNNVAEYSALIDAIKFMKSRNFYGPLLIKSDSKLVVNQMNGKWGAKPSGIYYPYYQEAKKLILSFEKIYFEWIPREQNYSADELSKKAYYEYIGNKNEH